MHLRGRDRLVQRERQVDVARREAADRVGTRDLGRCCEEDRQVQLEPRHPLLDAVGLEHFRVDLTDLAHGHAGEHDGGAPSGMQARQVAGVERHRTGFDGGDRRTLDR